MAMKIKPENKGKFTATKKRTGKSTSQLLHSKNALTRKRANFARMAKRHWKKLEEGGYSLPEYEYGNFITTSNLNIPQLATQTPDVLQGTNNTFTPFQKKNNSWNIDSGKPNYGAIGGLATLGSSLIDQYTNPEITETTVDINEGAAAASGALKGASLGTSILPGWGTAIGAVVGGVGSYLGATAKEKKMQEALDTKNASIVRQSQIKNRLANLSSTAYAPVAKQGGFIVYKGQTHEGPDGGILTDQYGNPSAVSNSKPIALTEKNEVARYEPNSGDTYIFSDSLGFAKPATRMVNKYKLNKSNSLYKYDPLLKTAVDKQFDNLTIAQEFARETKTPYEETMGIFKKGGSLTSSKAKEMLRDGTAHGKKLTARQKRYFGWIAEGKKEEGGKLPRTIYMPMQNKQYDRSLRINPTWASDVDSSKSIDDVYNSTVGTWQGQPLTMSKFLEFPSHVKDYYYPEFVVEQQKKRFGLENTFDQMNASPTPGNTNTNLYMPSSAVRAKGNRVAYYNKGGILPSYQEDGYLPDGDEYYLQDKAKRMVYPGIMGSITPDPFSDPNVVYSPPISTPKRSWGFPAKGERWDPFQNENMRVPGFYSGIQIGSDIKQGPNISTSEWSNKPIILKSGRVVAKPTGTGTPKVSRDTRTISPIDYQAPEYVGFYNQPKLSLAGAPAPADYGDARIALNKLEGSREANPILSPAGHILSGIGMLADYRALKKAKPTKANLGRVGAERISLAKQRLANRRNADLARATGSASARMLGTNAGTTLANITAANTGVNRLLGEQNAQLLEQEENANAQMRQQASMINAELAAQETLFNTQRLDAYNMLRARMNPTGNIARLAASYLADNAAYGRDFDLAQMYAPNYYLEENPNATFVDKYIMNRGYKLKPRK